MFGWNTHNQSEVEEWLKNLTFFHASLEEGWLDEVSIVYHEYPVFSIRVTGMFEGGCDIYLNYETQGQFIEDGLRFSA